MAKKQVVTEDDTQLYEKLTTVERLLEEVRTEAQAKYDKFSSVTDKEQEKAGAWNVLDLSTKAHHPVSQLVSLMKAQRRTMFNF